ncbi:isochorismatase family protein [Aeromicrobium sp. CFBP 8757]|uniref:isochorismatase family protein n=1 Tax=Aeromicrobium sp. CFBP 8757 TaxID=2775288 RepID=UPI001780663C|nr:isochorismatase family protein [Aeromicrobium sp. CFBP 8757]MBD8606268.1 isochorismatase family protein [Aeromicrobium sp. CFBP 8757]
MSSWSDRPHTALVVVDVQNDVVARAHDRDGVVGRIASLVDRARSNDVPVVWVQHHDDDLVQGSEAWRYVPELTQRESEPVVHKQYGDSFEGTDLEQVLAARRVGSLVVAGAQTDACIRSTVHGAFTRGYDVTLVGDAHTTDDFSAWGAPGPAEVVAHTNLYWSHQGAPGRTAAVVDAADVDFGTSGKSSQPVA